MSIRQQGHSSVGNTMTSNNWVGNIKMLNEAYTIEDKTIERELVRALGEQEYEWMFGMNPLGYNAVTSQEQFHWEEDFIQQFVTFVAYNGAGGSGAITLTINAAYSVTYPSAPVSPYIVDGTPASQPVDSQPGGQLNNTDYTVGGAFAGDYNIAGIVNPLTKNDNIQFPNGTQAKVLSVSGSAIVVHPMQEGESIPAVLSTDQIIIFGNSFGEATDQPLGHNWRPISVKSNLQIFKMTASSSNSALAKKIMLKSGSWHYENQKHTMKLFNNVVFTSILIGKKLTNLALAAIEPTNVTTEGLFPSIEQYGNNVSYFGTPTLDDLNDLIIQLEKNKAPDEMLMIEGIEASIAIDALMRAEFKNGGITYGSFNYDQKKAVDFGFDSFRLAGKVFHRTTYKPFNDKMVLGAEGQAYSSSIVFLPTDNRTASMTKTGSKITVPSMRLNYLSGNGENRLMKEWVTDEKSNNIDATDYNLLREIGLELFGLNRFAIMKKSV